MPQADFAYKTSTNLVGKLSLRHERTPSETSKIAIFGTFRSLWNYYDVTSTSQHVFMGRGWSRMLTFGR